jgi:hypothetical protein
MSNLCHNEGLAKLALATTLLSEARPWFANFEYVDGALKIVRAGWNEPPPSNRRPAKATVEPAEQAESLIPLLMSLLGYERGLMGYEENAGLDWVPPNGPGSIEVGYGENFRMDFPESGLHWWDRWYLERVNNTLNFERERYDEFEFVEWE